MAPLFLLYVLLHGVAVSARSRLDSRQDTSNIGYDNICHPVTPDGNLDLNTPCNAANDIDEKCYYGVNITETNQNPNSLTQQSSQLEQQCICTSAYFGFLEGCQDCKRLHGGPELTPNVNVSGWYPVNYLRAVGNAYCESDGNQDLNHFIAAYVQSTPLETGEYTTVTSAALPNVTDASLYFMKNFTTTAGAGLNVSFTATTSSSSSSTGMSGVMNTDTATSTSTPGATGTSSQSSASSSPNAAASNIRSTSIGAAWMLIAVRLLL